MSQVFIIIVVAWGSLLNVMAHPWSATDSLLERRRNDWIAITLWLMLGGVTITAIDSGITNRNGPGAFNLQDWTALILPWVVAGPYLIELVAVLVRQIEMWRWMQRSCAAALPLAWMYRTMTVGEIDDDGEWLRRSSWSPCEHHATNISASTCTIWDAISHDATFNHLLSGWKLVLLSALKYAWIRSLKNMQSRKYFRAFHHSLVTCAVAVVLSLCIMLQYLSLLEKLIFVAFDYGWWKRCIRKGRIISRYKTVHFGRLELQAMFEQSHEIRKKLRVGDNLNLIVVHDRIMSSVITTTAVLENAFRRSYLVVPVYAHAMSNRKALRNHYQYVNCELDVLIKNIRILLEMRHTTGLLSITSSTGTVEAALHNNIESILSVSLYYPPVVLYNVATRIAQIEHDIECRLRDDSACNSITAENVTRERCVYIDARNAVFWLLWVMVVRDWTDPAALWETEEKRKLSGDDIAVFEAQFPVRRTEVIYVIAYFLSRARYCKRYGFDEKCLFVEVKTIVDRHGTKAICEEFNDLSKALQRHRDLTLLEWTEREYNITWHALDMERGLLECEWRSDDDGSFHRASCELAPSSD